MTGFTKIARLDFFTMKPQAFSYFAVVPMILMFGFIGSPTSISCITGAWFMALMASNIFAIQEKSNLDRLYASVSVSLKDIVLGRYIFMFMNYLVAFFVIIAVNFGFAFYRNTQITALDILDGFSFSFFVFSTITGIQMPLFFKMGYTKAKILSLIPVVAVMALMVIPPFISALSGIVDFMQSHRKVMVIIGVLASCVIQLISYHIAVLSYRKQK